jgi:serine protease
VVDFGSDLAGDPPFTYRWTFGDGMTSTQTMPSHEYGASGTYTGTLEVWNCQEAEYDMATFVVTVECGAPPTYGLYLPIIIKPAGP